MPYKLPLNKLTFSKLVDFHKLTGVLDILYTQIFGIVSNQGKDMILIKLTFGNYIYFHKLTIYFSV